jgi:hypothetical protein
MAADLEFWLRRWYQNPAVVPSDTTRIMMARIDGWKSADRSVEGADIRSRLQEARAGLKPAGICFCCAMAKQRVPRKRGKSLKVVEGKKPPTRKSQDDALGNVRPSSEFRRIQRVVAARWRSLASNRDFVLETAQLKFQLGRALAKYPERLRQFFRQVFQFFGLKGRKRTRILTESVKGISGSC